MTLRLALGTILLIGAGTFLYACNTDDNIADGTGGQAGIGGQAGSTMGGSAGNAGQGGQAGKGGQAGQGGTGGDNPDGGPCQDACQTSGATKCMGGVVITCAKAYTGCLAWQGGEACPTGQTCNADATKCVGPATDCATDADCGCGCGCNSGKCMCTGVIPPTCSTDADCGPACYGFACVNGKCDKKIGPEPCVDPCQAGTSRCVGKAMQECKADGNGCNQWAALSDCPSGEGCNSDGTKCVNAPVTCATDTDCGCGCGCVAGECKCTGGVPPTCTKDSECGPTCAGLACISGKCEQAPQPPPDGGTCVPECTIGEKVCQGSTLLECGNDGNGCPIWATQTACPAGQTCNSDGTQCVDPAATCSTDTDCGCGCGCVAGECKCTGVVPPSCTADADCGPACSGFICLAGACVQLPKP
ncbi:MAG: hypothetical protein HY898_09035 [Deltaproteobacteria bacterium]|nr:hypothetical protein [Deltaproteobacteria bacterium]